MNSHHENSVGQRISDSFINDFPIVLMTFLNSFSDLAAVIEYKLYSIINIH